MTSLDRRKKALREFYEEVDPGRIKNIDPLFNHFTFIEIFKALKDKYRKLPEDWEVEYYKDWVGHVNPKKIINVMKKKGLNPALVLGEKPKNSKVRGRSVESFSQMDEDPSMSLRNNIVKTSGFSPPSPVQSKKGTTMTRVKIKRETQVSKNTSEKDRDSEDLDALFNAPTTSFILPNSPSDFTVGSSVKIPPPPPPYDMVGSPLALEKQMKTSVSAPQVQTQRESSIQELPRATSSGNLPGATLEIMPPPIPPPRKNSKSSIKKQLEKPQPPPKPMQELTQKVKPIETETKPPPANPMQELLQKVKPVESAPPANPMQELLQKMKPVETRNAPANPMQELLQKVKPVESVTALPNPMAEKDGVAAPTPTLKKTVEKSSSSPANDPAEVKEEPEEKKKPKKFNAMHEKLLALHGGGGSKTTLPPVQRSQTKVSSAFADMHKKLQLSMPGGKVEAPKKDAVKAEGLAKKFAEKTKGKELKDLSPGTPEFEKYTKMQKTGLPEGAIRNCIERDGYDPESFYNPSTESQPQPQTQQQTPKPNPVASNPMPTPVATQPQPLSEQPVQQMSVQQQQPVQQMSVQQQQPLQQVSVQQQPVPQMMQQQQMTQAQREYEIALRKYEQDLFLYQQQLMQKEQELQRQESMRTMTRMTSHKDMQRKLSSHQMTSASSQRQVLRQKALTNKRQMVKVQGSAVNDQGWSIQWSDQYQRPYYHNHYTNESTWTPPPGM